MPIEATSFWRPHRAATSCAPRSTSPWHSRSAWSPTSRSPYREAGFRAPPRRRGRRATHADARGGRHRWRCTRRHRDRRVGHRPREAQHEFPLDRLSDDRVGRDRRVRSSRRASLVEHRLRADEGQFRAARGGVRQTVAGRARGRSELGRQDHRPRARDSRAAAAAAARHAAFSRSRWESLGVLRDRVARVARVRTLQRDVDQHRHRRRGRPGTARFPCCSRSRCSSPSLLWYALARRAGNVAALPIVLAALFVIASLLLDARWTWNLARQADATRRQIRRQGLACAAPRRGGRAAVRVHRARCARSCRSTPVPGDSSPPTPTTFAAAARFISIRTTSSSTHVTTRCPRRGSLRPGDYLVVYQRRGVQFDPAQQKLRWDGGEPVSAELLLAEGGAAAFRIR